MEANNHKVFVMKEWRTAFYLPNRIYNRSVTIGAERNILLQALRERGESSGLCGFCGFKCLPTSASHLATECLRVSLKTTRMGITMHRNGGIPLSRIKFSYQFVSFPRLCVVHALSPHKKSSDIPHHATMVSQFTAVIGSLNS